MSYDTESGAEHITLLVDNYQQCYNQKIAMFQNLEKKFRKGIYDRGKALIMFKHLTDKVRLTFNKNYGKEDGIIPISASRLADKLLRQEFETDYLRNEKGYKNTSLTGRF